jgi:hypothetical protein
MSQLQMDDFVKIEPAPYIKHPGEGYFYQSHDNQDKGSSLLIRRKQRRFGNNEAVRCRYII